MPVAPGVTSLDCCCGGDTVAQPLSLFWLADADPNLKVKFATFANSDAVEAEQSSLGFQMNFTSVSYDSFPSTGELSSELSSHRQGLLCR